MTLELLPNELLLLMFEYLKDNELLSTFYGLNSRFNNLLYQQIPFYNLNLNSVSKRSVDIICQQHLPIIYDRIIALSLSDDRETPTQINLFYSSITSFNIFIRLKSLTLSNLHYYKILLKIITECEDHPNLTHLNLKSCSFPIYKIDFQLLINQIWKLSNLTHCQLDINNHYRSTFHMPTIHSTSIQYLTLLHCKFKWNQINQLIYYTPYLRHFLTDMKSFTDEDYIVSPITTLNKFDLLSFPDPTTSRLTALFHTMPNLCYLNITMLYELIDGHAWKHIICNHLVKLRTFRLQMQSNIAVRYSSRSCIKEYMNKLIDSFQDPFWIIEHEWYVRCINQNITIHLYTLPNTSDYYKDIFPDSWKSTYPYDNQLEVYNRLTTIYDEKFFDQLICSNIRLFNLVYLRIKFPINDQFWSIVPSLNRLHTLIISSYTDIYQSQLQNLLDRASQLHTLRFHQDRSIPWQLPLECINISIRSLNVYDSNHSFNEEYCIALSRSPLTRQCEVLWITVQNHLSIISLIKNLRNLRVLIVKCTNENPHEQSVKTMNNDEIIYWLQEHLPSTYSIERDRNIDGNIIIWM